MFLLHESCCSFFTLKCGRFLLMHLSFMFTGAVALVSVDQPADVTAALGHDAVLPCELRVSQDEKIQTTPVLYWADENKQYLLDSNTKYDGRAHRLDQDLNSSNKSIVLKKVQWSDSKKYECKLSVTTEKAGSFRSKGNQTTLLIYDSILFNISRHNDSLLHCEVNVTQNPGFVLSVIHSGCKLQSVDADTGNSVFHQTVIRLSQTVFLRGGGKYECQLHLRKDLKTTSVLHMQLPDPVRFPEPWFLYTSLLLVPVLVILILLPVMLICR